MSDNLGEDLVFEIFTRLPTKSLLRFRSLSKSFCSIISSPSFIDMQTFRSPQKLLIIHHEDKKKDFYTLHSEDQFPPCPIRGYFGITPVEVPYEKDSSIVGSCNGIICLVDKKKRITLWNPSIRQTLTLPRGPQNCTSMVVIGFGFDPIIDDYKIVSISYPYTYVYAMKTGAWCALVSTPTPMFPFRDVLPNACFVNGALHWVVGSYFSKSDNVDHNCIMTFDLSTNVFGMIALPESKWRRITLTTYQGSLAVIYIKNGDGWMWVRRDASWDVVYQSDTKQIWRGVNRIMRLTTDGDMLFDTDKNGFQVYNHKIGESTKLVAFNGACHIAQMEWCSETLQLLGMRAACEGNQPSLLEGKKERRNNSTSLIDELHQRI